MAKRLRARRPTVVLEQALADVREGKTPYINGAKDIATLEVIDPFDGKKRRKVIALRNDPLAFMHARGRVDDVQLKAGRAYQRDHQSAEIGGARGIDPAVTKVDGGRFSEPDTDRRLRAHAELARIHTALGERGRDLVHMVLGLNIPVAQVAQMWGQMEQVAYRALRLRFVECLDTIAQKKGFAPDRPAPGPRRARDGYDNLARHADNPILHTAIRLAREA